MLPNAFYYIGLVAICYILLIYYIIRFTLRYQHEYESSKLIAITTITCLSVVLIAAAILPVDIYLVSSIKDSDGVLKPWVNNGTLGNIRESILGSYYATYGTTIVLIFVVLPFIHFYHEEQSPDGMSVPGRCLTAFKYTFAFSLVASLLLVAGSFLPLSAPDSGSSIWNKILEIFSASKAQDALNLLMSIITTLGMVNVALYTGFGIISWPVGLLRGTDSINQHYENLTDRQMSLRIRVNALIEKSRITALTARERNQLERAENELRTMSQEEQVITDYSNSLTYRLRNVIRPSQIVFGSLLLVLAALILVTLIISNVDKLMNGMGAKAGYTLLTPHFINPLNFILVEFQNWSILAPLPILLILFFLILATISGMRNLGLWLLVFPVYKFKVRRTTPQGLLYFCISMMLTVLAYNMLLYFLVPQFVTYGNQMFVSNSTTGNSTTLTAKQCTLEQAGDECFMTTTATLIVRFMSQVWIFGPIFYWLSWVFGAIALISTVALIFRNKRPAVHGLISQDEFEEE